jgi:hypothetical protein
MIWRFLCEAAGYVYHAIKKCKQKSRVAQKNLFALTAVLNTVTLVAPPVLALLRAPREENPGLTAEYINLQFIFTGLSTLALAATLARYVKRNAPSFVVKLSILGQMLNVMAGTQGFLLRNSNRIPALGGGIPIITGATGVAVFVSFVRLVLPEGASLAALFSRDILSAKLMAESGDPRQAEGILRCSTFGLIANDRFGLKKQKSGAALEVYVSSYGEELKEYGMWLLKMLASYNSTIAVFDYMSFLLSRFLPYRETAAWAVVSLTACSILAGYRKEQPLSAPLMPLLRTCDHLSDFLDYGKRGLSLGLIIGGTIGFWVSPALTYEILMDRLRTGDHPIGFGQIAIAAGAGFVGLIDGLGNVLALEFTAALNLKRPGSMQRMKAEFQAIAASLGQQLIQEGQINRKAEERLGLTHRSGSVASSPAVSARMDAFALYQHRGGSLEDNFSPRHRRSPRSEASGEIGIEIELARLTGDPSPSPGDH